MTMSAKDALKYVTAGDIARGLWWYCNDYHGGMMTPEYSYLSAGPYKPGAAERSPVEGEESETAEPADENEEAAQVYRDLEDGVLDFTETVSYLAAALAEEREE